MYLMRCDRWILNKIEHEFSEMVCIPIHHCLALSESGDRHKEYGNSRKIPLAKVFILFSSERSIFNWR